MFWICSLAIVAIAILLRVWMASTVSVRGDELFSYRVATSTLRVGIQRARQDLVHPPFYYLLLKVFLALFGPSVLNIRLLSILAGVMTVGSIPFFSRVPGFRIAAPMAAFLVALNLVHIQYSDEARSYALYTLLTTLLLLWLCRLDSRKKKPTFWVVGTLLACASMYTHYVGVLVVASVLLGTWLSDGRRHHAITMFACAIIAAVLFCPWLFGEVKIYHRKHGLDENLAWQGLPTLHDLRNVWAQFMGLPQFRGATSIIFILGMSLIVLAVFYTFREFRTGESDVTRHVVRTLLAVTFMPPAIIYAVSIKPFSLPVFGLRHVLPSLVAWSLLVCYGLCETVRHLWTSKNKSQLAILVPAFAILVSLQLSATIPGMKNNFDITPYSNIARDLSSKDPFIPVYTTWPYGIGETVNFYVAGHRRVLAFPPAIDGLPEGFVLLYRPDAPKEAATLQKLVAAGWASLGRKDYKASAKSQHYTSLVYMCKQSCANLALFLR